jgi:mutator protein MutT
MKTHAVIVLINEKNELLFVKRSMKKKTLPGIWSFASGTMEEGENPLQTVRREAIEELGVNVNPEKVFAEVELPELSSKLIFVLCPLREGQPSIKEPDEIDQIKWMKIEDFFRKFNDGQIGHGLVWLRKNPAITEGLQFRT